MWNLLCFVDREALSAYIRILMMRVGMFSVSVCFKGLKGLFVGRLRRLNFAWDCNVEYRTNMAIVLFFTPILYFTKPRPLPAATLNYKNSTVLGFVKGVVRFGGYGLFLGYSAGLPSFSIFSMRLTQLLCHSVCRLTSATSSSE